MNNMLSAIFLCLAMDAAAVVAVRVGRQWCDQCQGEEHWVDRFRIAWVSLTVATVLAMPSLLVVYVGILWVGQQALTMWGVK